MYKLHRRYIVRSAKFDLEFAQNGKVCHLCESCTLEYKIQGIADLLFISAFSK